MLARFAVRIETGRRDELRVPVRPGLKRPALPMNSIMMVGAQERTLIDISHSVGGPGPHVMRFATARKPFAAREDTTPVANG
jgi:hypothetical protein